ncbi:nitronate monooxygenase [Congregibacter variabilis]|uniref:Propionate 3-nitronate monooxygenase n=1 Tax=Congregibacter variabilis TaxID=3081200 RepID=A0ABZ0I7P5_9GAMM|nr:nitronate monooxygenase [Congregibacter sp. IMCC43200]
MVTRLTDLFGLKYPIIQAPMAGVSTPALAAAVSNAGGLGSVALGALTPAAAARALKEIFALTSGPVVANLFVHRAPRVDAQLARPFLTEIAPAFESVKAQAPESVREIYPSFNDDDDMLEILLDLQPTAVSLHFGTATASRMRAFKQAGIMVLATATSVAEALALEETGVDFLVMQSYGAGGHSGAFLGPPDLATAGGAGLSKLVRDTVAAVELPVVAAGGLMTGRDVADVIAAGATGAQMGTAFIACPESLASDRYCELLLSGAPTRLTSNISGRPARSLVNELLLWADGLAADPPDYPLCYDAVKQLVAAKQNADFSVMWAGEGANMSRRLPARELLTVLAAELADA